MTQVSTKCIAINNSNYNINNHNTHLYKSNSEQGDEWAVPTEVLSDFKAAIESIFWCPTCPPAGWPFKFAGARELLTDSRSRWSIPDLTEPRLYLWSGISSQLSCCDLFVFVLIRIKMQSFKSLTVLALLAVLKFSWSFTCDSFDSNMGATFNLKDLIR